MFGYLIFQSSSCKKQLLVEFQWWESWYVEEKWQKQRKIKAGNPSDRKKTMKMLTEMYFILQYKRGKDS